MELVDKANSITFDIALAEKEQIYASLLEQLLAVVRVRSPSSDRSCCILILATCIKLWMPVLGAPSSPDFARSVEIGRLQRAPLASRLSTHRAPNWSDEKFVGIEKRGWPVDPKAGHNQKQDSRLFGCHGWRLEEKVRPC
jgi:hypothetical protein